MLAEESRLWVGVGPQEMGSVKKGREVQVLYRMDGALRLRKAGGNFRKTRGNLMGIDTVSGSARGDVAYFCQQVKQQVALFEFGGICCLFEGQGHGAYVEVLEDLRTYCKKNALEFMVTEGYGQVGGKVLLSTAISGGTLAERFQWAVAQYGAERVVMDIQCMREDFLLPSPKGTGVHLSPRELADLSQRARVFYSSELCARYFTYENGSHSLHFVLFDEEGTVREKLRLGKLWHLAGAFVRYHEVGRWKI